jgi:hypothetical protein
MTNASPESIAQNVSDLAGAAADDMPLDLAVGVGVGVALHHLRIDQHAQNMKSVSSKGVRHAQTTPCIRVLESSLVSYPLHAVHAPAMTPTTRHTSQE